MISMLDPARYAAANARVHGRLAQLLSAMTWQDLLIAPDLPEVLRILTGTVYGQVLARIPAERLEPDWIERALRQYLVEAYRAPIRFTPRGPQELVDWLWRRFELDNVKLVLRGVEQGRPAQRIQARLVPLGEASELPWGSLVESVSVPAVVERLEGTFYGDVLELALDRYLREELLFVLEVVLDRTYYRRLRDLSEGLSGRDKQEARLFVGTIVDSENVLWAFRYRIYYNLGPEEILNYTLHRGVRVGVDVIRNIALGAGILETVEQIWGEELPNLDRLVGLSEREMLDELELIFKRYLYDLARQAFTGYFLHLGIILAYEILLETEVQDLIVIVEGKAADWSPDQIRPYLTGMAR
jgi:V/A-type H+-transporting ATPase subunit C